MRKTPTSKDVAEAAGVSQTMVSFVMNGSTRGTDETRRRVREAARTLGYRPNLSARSLVQGRTQTLGVLILDLMNPFFAAAAHHLEQAIRAEGYHFVLSTSGYDAWRTTGQMSDLLEDLLLRQVDAIIAWSIRDPAHASAAADPLQALRLLPAQTPLFLLGYDESADGCAYFDHAKGGRVAAQHLLACGRRRLDAIGNFAESRFDGFWEVLREAGMSPDRELWRDPVDNRSSEATGYRAGERIAALPAPHRPDGIFCVNDLVATGLLSGLQDNGIRVPEDIAVVGFDALAGTQYLRPSLASVAYPLDRLCCTVVSQAVRHLRGEALEPEEKFVSIPPLGLRPGQSAPLPTGLA